MVWREATFFCWVSVGTCLLGVAAELYRLVRDSQGLVMRLKAFDSHVLSEFDLEYANCLRYFVPSTVLSIDPGGIAFGELFHCLNILVLLAVAGAEFPNVKWLINKWDPWMQLFGKSASSWYEGALQLWIGWALLGMPTSHPLGDGSAAWVRFMAGWLLIAASLGNIVLGMTTKDTVRIRRGQVAKEGGGMDPAEAVKTWRAWRTVITTVYAEHMQVGSLRDSLLNMDKAIGDLE